MCSEYLGKGAAAEQQLARDRIRQAETRRRLAEAALDQQLDELERILCALSRALLYSRGYYLHKRQWRRRHDYPSPR